MDLKKLMFPQNLISRTEVINHSSVNSGFKSSRYNNNPSSVIFIASEKTKSARNKIYFKRYSNEYL